MKYLILAIITAFFFSCCINEKAKEVMTQVQYRGTITSVYNDINNHQMFSFSVNTDTGNIGVTAESFPYSWEYASVGDSIIKPKNELYIMIKKKNGFAKVFYYK